MLTSVGRIEVKKGHVLCNGTAHFGISERLRISMCIVGQSVVYQEGSELFKELMGLEISGSQIQRVCVHYGGLVDPLIEKNCQSVIPQLADNPTSPQPTDPTYVMLDGCLIFTRPDLWREVKLGRIFRGSNVVNIHEKRRMITDSVYVSHLGSVDKFLPKLERHLVTYPHKVIIGDGAKWIWNWVEDNYPGAIQILDFYHAKEKLVLFAKYQYLEESKRKNWVNQQCERLLNNELEMTMQTIKATRARSTEAKEAKQKLLNYYLEHEDRMQYKTYRAQGLLIGSGPIEAAHRNVIQQRLKLSGQKWSENGAQAILNLRCYRKSGAWNSIEKIIAAAA